MREVAAVAVARAPGGVRVDREQYLETTTCPWGRGGQTPLQCCPDVIDLVLPITYGQTSKTLEWDTSNQYHFRMPYYRRIRRRTGRKFYRTGYQKRMKVFVGVRRQPSLRGIRRAMDV